MSKIENKSGNRGTAVVTGASSGIGAVYAERLAGQGYDLLLVARRADRLEALAETIRQKHGHSVAIFPAGNIIAQDGILARLTAAGYEVADPSRPLPEE